jgi:hypothetical protein
LFALLEHVTNPAADARHWDLLVELPGQELLATWQLGANPLATPGPVPAARIADHRRLYLTYEGEISGERGRVTRLDGGAANVQQTDTDELLLELCGARLVGRYELARSPRGLVFRPAS